MTNPNITHITLVCDRSGSMQMIREDAEGGVNAFIDDQKTVGKPCTFHLVDFDAGPNNYRTVYKGLLSEAPKYVLEPRGGTALLDAVGRAINETGGLLKALPEADRPGLVFFVIQTDGAENSSHEFTLDQIKAMIKEQEAKYDWNFVFLGMGPDAFAQGVNWGIANTTRSASSGVAYASSYSNTSGGIKASRNAGVVLDSNFANVVVDDEGNVTDASGSSQSTGTNV